MELKKTQRNQVKLRIGLSGVSGVGKTHSALLLAYGITEDWNKIAVIDTENNSASLYAHLGDFNVVNLEAPYSPERYVEAIQLCEATKNIDVIIIDGISQEWNGIGGCLQIHRELGSRFQDWGKVTPRHNRFINTILHSNCHVITTTRRKVDYSLEKDPNGRTKVVKHGTKEITRSGWEYELTVNFEFTNISNHMVRTSKDRTGLFKQHEFVITKGVGRRLKEWCQQGKDITVQSQLVQNNEVVK
ncbi:AAA family ATPase [Tenacibaculum sp. IMCC1]